LLLGVFNVSFTFCDGVERNILKYFVHCCTVAIITLLSQPVRFETRIMFTRHVSRYIESWDGAVHSHIDADWRMQPREDESVV